MRAIENGWIQQESNNFQLVAANVDKCCTRVERMEGTKDGDGGRKEKSGWNIAIFSYFKKMA
jgi:hypothetical protein